MLDFCAEHQVVADIELIRADGIEAAFERMLRSDVKYRFVIDTALSAGDVDLTASRAGDTGRFTRGTTTMRLPTVSWLLALAACAGRTPAYPAASRASDCFDAARVAGWDSAGPSRIRVRVNGASAFELGLVGPRCVDVAWSPTIAIASNTGSPWICIGEGVGLGEVRFQDGPSGPVVLCRIATVSRPE